MDFRADLTDCRSSEVFSTSVTQRELAAERPASNAEESPARSIMTKSETAQKGRRFATACTPIIDVSTDLGRLIWSAGLAARKPNVEREIGTMAKSIEPKIK